MEQLISRLMALLSVKSLVTMILTIVFAIKTMGGEIGQDFMTIYAMIIAFYFGTQGSKGKDRDYEQMMRKKEKKK